ncbi:MAG: redoxin domain-containing protein [Gemmatimonadaceae bacterium]
MNSTGPRTPSAGQTAPDFTLPSSSNTPVTLSTSRGASHVLLAFFPGAFSSTCTAELCALRDDFDQFAGRGVTVYGISVDSHHALREFKAMHHLQVELLSDFKREVTVQYGLLHAERFFSNRAYILIDKTGIIRWVHVEETPGQRRENIEILAEIAMLS